MSNQPPALDPSRVEDIAMTNHLTHAANSEHINGSIAAKPSHAQLVRQDSSETIDAKPKSTFKITSVTLHPQKGSSQDGRHSFGDDDEESALDDSQSHANVEDSPAPPNHHTDVVKQGQRQDRVDSTSRFKVVKIQKRKPYTVGRWRISDFVSESEASTNKIVGDVTQVKRSDSGNSSRASSTHYVHGVDDPAKNPLASINTSSNATLASIQQSPLQQSGLNAVVSVETAGVNTQDSQLNAAKPEHITDNIVSRIEADTGQSKDPHLIGQSQQLPSNQSLNTSDISRSGAQAALGHSNQHPGTTTEQSTLTVQANTQKLPQSATTNVPQVAVTVPVPLASGSSSESQSSTLDAHHKPPDEPPAALPSVSKPPSNAAEQIEIPGGVRALAANLTELVDPSAAADGDKAEDADATATGVAIDNKIEQAMDLVKSHLMLAVREEVEDLKLQIKQLIERNSLLEQENKLLRSSAAPETMAQLALLNRQQNH